jgi:hypothetical protein
VSEWVGVGGWVRRWVDGGSSSGGMAAALGQAEHHQKQQARITRVAHTREERACAHACVACMCRREGGGTDVSMKMIWIFSMSPARWMASRMTMSPAMSAMVKMGRFFVSTARLSDLIICAVRNWSRSCNMWCGVGQKSEMTRKSGVCGSGSGSGSGCGGDVVVKAFCNGGEMKKKRVVRA